MDFVILWFVLAAGGYIAPMDVRSPQCGLSGLVVGILVDRVVNPTAVLWPDPQTVGEHCRVDVTDRVAGVAPGEYHFATTIVGKAVAFGVELPPRYQPHDPHTSVSWVRQVGPGTEPSKPATLQIRPRGN